MKNTLIGDKEKDKLKRVTVNVTKRDIEKGIIGKCESCPVALAFNRLLKKPYRTVVGFITVRYESITGDGNVFGPDLPDNVSKFINSFDSSKNPTPLKFRMSIPKMVLKHP